MGQLLGAMLGFVLVYLLYAPHWKETKEDTLGIFATGPAIDCPAFNLVAEIIGTFFLVFVIYLVNHHPMPNHLRPLAIGLFIVSMGILAEGVNKISN